MGTIVLFQKKKKGCGRDAVSHSPAVPLFSCNLPAENRAQCSLSFMRIADLKKLTHIVPSILTRSRFLS